MTSSVPRLADEDLVELEELLEQLAAEHRPSGVQPWETVQGRRLELVDQLVTTASRQAKVGAGGGTSSEPAHQRPVPYVANASDVAAQLAGLLAEWVRDTERLDDRDAPIGPRRPSADSGAARDLAAWLLTRLPALADRPGTSRLHLDALRRLVRRGRTIVDRPADRWYAGPCSTPLRDDDDNLVIDHGEQVFCEADLYAKPEAARVICTACGAIHRVDDRRAQLLSLARDRRGRPVDISRALTSFGMPCTPDRIRKWVQRGRLTSPDGLYRIGDVMDLLVADAQRRDRTAARKRTA